MSNPTDFVSLNGTWWNYDDRTRTHRPSYNNDPRTFTHCERTLRHAYATLQRVDYLISNDDSEDQRMIFTIPGPPVGKGRPRATTINGMARMYTPKKTASYETLVVMAYTLAGGVKLDGNIHMHIKAVFEMPRSLSMEKRQAMEGKFCGKKPDADNILKIVADALNGVAYHDDAAIGAASIEKRWGQDGSVTVELFAMNEVVK